MNHATTPILAAFTCLFVFAICLEVSAEATLSEPKTRTRQNFDAGWRFIKEDITGAQEKDFDDKAWRELNLPHDWSIEGPFDKKALAGAPGGYLPNGIGWYRKTFDHAVDDRDLKTFIEFDSVYKNSEVSVSYTHLTLPTTPYV